MYERQQQRAFGDLRARLDVQLFDPSVEGGDEAMARVAADRGYWLSFAGNVTFKNAQNLRDALAVTPLERILVETDAPFLTPTPFRGRPNAPYLVPVTVRFMAAELGIDLDAFCAQLAANTLDVYGAFED